MPHHARSRRSEVRATERRSAQTGRELRHFLDSNADQPGGSMRKGDYYFARNDPQTALLHYRRAVLWDPYSAPFRQQLAVALSVLNPYISSRPFSCVAEGSAPPAAAK